MGLNIETEYVTDIQKIMFYNILSTPALVINEQVASTGKVLSSSNIIKMITK
ncbi:MAG: thioredoxin family protein [Mucispirillum sp.]|nr:thioredoxin family protein [Mucispirillum sp.]